MFDAQSFLDATVSTSNDTRVIPVPVGEYLGIVDKVTPRQWQSKDGTQSGIAMDILWLVEDAAVKQALGRETIIVKQASLAKGIIIDCGGGIVHRAENLAMLKINGIVFYLQASPETIYQRIKNEAHRPLLNAPNPMGVIKDLYKQRLPLYNQADYIINADDESIEVPIVEILKKL